MYDSRGHFREPHTGVKFEIGTSEVREYVAAWRSEGIPTRGPANRFRYAVFLEKEGFDALLEESGIAKRFDLSFYSTKGMSVTAARELVENLSNAGVTTFVAHDFDFSGFSILHTFGHDTRRYEFGTVPKVIDFGLRLVDAQKMNLEKEPVVLQQNKDPRIKLREYGALPDEIDFLIGDRHGYGKSTYWDGFRIELNAMTSRQLIEWLETKLKEHGVEKVVPGTDLLGPIWRSSQKAAAYSRFAAQNGGQVRELEAQLENLRAQLGIDFDQQYTEPETPKNLRERVRKYLGANP
jgi:hypothetical protein